MQRGHVVEGRVAGATLQPGMQASGADLHAGAGSELLEAVLEKGSELRVHIVHVDGGGKLGGSGSRRLGMLAASLGVRVRGVGVAGLRKQTEKAVKWGAEV